MKLNLRLKFSSTIKEMKKRKVNFSTSFEVAPLAFSTLISCFFYVPPRLQVVERKQIEIRQSFQIKLGYFSKSFRQSSCWCKYSFSLFKMLPRDCLRLHATFQASNFSECANIKRITFPIMPERVIAVKVVWSRQ